MTWKGEDNHRDLQEYNRAGDREVNSRDYQRVVENKELDLMEGLIPPKRKKWPHTV
jgi:hypothetical protein